MDNRDKFISANDVLVGTRTFKECYRENENVFSPELVEFANNVLNMVEEFVNKTPPADVAKVLHGHWEIDKSYMPFLSTCSECGALYTIDGAFDWNYCPDCGAFMKGDKNGN